MFTELDGLLSDLPRKNPASDKALSEFKARHPDVPLDFIYLHSIWGDFDVFLGEEYLTFWPMTEIEPANRDYSVEEFAPGLLLFASNGGLSAYAYNTNEPCWPIVEVDYIGMSLEESRPTAENLVEMFRLLRDGKKVP